MKKYFFMALVLFMISISFNANAQCKLPNGVTTTPAWTQGSPNMRIYYNISDDKCWVEYTWCHRTLPNGQKEIALGDIILGDDCSWWEDNIYGCDCDDSYEAKKEMLMDRAIGAITMEYNRFNVAGNIAPCNVTNSNSPTVFTVYTSKCKTVPYFNYTEHNGKQVISPCTGEGYCKYQYKYCTKMIDGVLTSTFTKTVLDGVTSQCPEDEEVSPMLFKDCLPSDCYQTRVTVKVINEQDVYNFNDQTYYPAWSL